MMRDYDPSIGRYVESDPIGIKGLLARNSEVARLQHFLGGSYRLAKGGTQAIDVEALMGLSIPRAPETLLYGYAGDNPLVFADPTGESTAGWAVIITGAVIGGTLYAMQDCAKKCRPMCPIPNTGEPGDERDRDTWIWSCQIGCIKSFGGFLKKYSAPAPPIEGLIN